MVRKRESKAEFGHQFSVCLRKFGTAFGVVAFTTLAACAETASILPATGNASGGDKAAVKPAFSQFPDIPIPGGAKINVDKTLVFGSKPWFGQLTLNTSDGANAMYDFYRAELPGFDWQEITSVRAPTSILTYAREEQVLAIAIRSATLRGAEVTITVSPRGKSEPKPAGILPPPVTNTNQ